MARADNGSGKTTDSHHHIYDSRYPIDPAAQLRPADATVADYRALRQRLGIGRHVVVQPSTYGTDNRCLLDALSQFGADARGIAAVADTVTDSELQNLHEAGVRGLRFNLEFLVGLTVAMIEPLAKRIDPLGWHIQVNASAAQILEHRQLLASLSSALVIDHMGQIPQPTGVAHPAFRVIEDLMARGRTWVKLSGPYLVSRTGAPGYADVGVVARSLAQLAPDRMIWGSDWPHPTGPWSALPARRPHRSDRQRAGSGGEVLGSQCGRDGFSRLRDYLDLWSNWRNQSAKDYDCIFAARP